MNRFLLLCTTAIGCGVVAAVPAHARPNLHGTVTIESTGSRTFDAGYGAQTERSSGAATFTLPGAIGFRPSNSLVDAAWTSMTTTAVTSYDFAAHNDYQQYCRFEQYAGRMVSTDTLFDLAPTGQDRYLGRAVVRDLTPSPVATPALAEVRSGECGEPGEPRTRDVTHRPTNQGSMLAPGCGSASMRIPSLVLRRGRDGIWRSEGSLSRTVEGCNHTITLRWNLRSTRPSDECRLPGVRMVRGRTVAAARTILRRGGFGTSIVVKRRSRLAIPRGRVVTVGAAGRYDRCGARPVLYVKA